MVSNARSLKPTSLNINSFQWANNTKGKLSLYISTGKDSSIQEFFVSDVPMIKFSPNGTLYSTKNGIITPLPHVINKLGEKEVDIGEIMYQRALNGYSAKGVKEGKNLGEENLDQVWNFVNNLKKMPEKFFEIGEHDFSIEGVSEIMTSLPVSIPSPIDIGVGFPMELYQNKYRDIGLAMCGWDFSKTDANSIEAHIKRYQQVGDFEKAAGLIFLYNVDLAQTIECLSSSRSIVF
jgi:hypothetical protein